MSMSQNQINRKEKYGINGVSYILLSNNGLIDTSQAHKNSSNMARSYWPFGVKRRKLITTQYDTFIKQ